GVVVAPVARRAVERALAGTAPAVTLLDPPDAKGLEFDAVVVVEPAAIAGDSARGLRLLYVALTRAVQELVVVHAHPLPTGLSLAAPAA
ncbi:MAG TPA: ATP-binding domain-containing protein, partial [Acidimicrobiales bacterium]|nr:ATP-binding domain-containing protein [Acidimicrobiales bacterium]